MLINPGGKNGVVFVVLGVLALSAIAALWTLSAGSLDNHECFVSVTSREMLTDGNWIMPTFNGQPRLQKTPLSYWIVACISSMAGGVNEFTARLPSAMFAVLSVCAILYFVGQWLSFRTAVVCAGVWLTSFGYIRYSHNARPEMALTFFVVLCFLSFYSAVAASSRKRQIIYMLVFWVSFGLGNLAKGPAPIAMVGIPVLAYIAVTKQWRFIGKMLPVWGVAIFLLIMLPWPIAAAYKVNWDVVIWKREFVDRFFGGLDPLPKPFYYYLPLMFMFIAPWVAFLPMAIAAPFYKVWGEKRPAMRFLWVFFVADLVFLFLSGGKRQHYIMPIMPAAAILVGIVLDDMIFENKAFLVGQARGVLRMHLVAAFLLAAGLVGYSAFCWRQFLPASLVTAGVIAATAVVVGVLFARKKPLVACGGVFAGIVAVSMTVWVGFINPLGYNEPSRHFMQAVAQTVPAAEAMISYKAITPRVIHYFGRPIRVVMDEAEVYKYYQQGYWVITFGGGLDELVKTGRYNVLYVKQDVERFKSTPVAGGLLHKQSPSVKSAEGSSL
jgi:4-amino-4-deoxy-L-arabinose transferase-like glycosyltransferase